MNELMLLAQNTADSSSSEGFNWIFVLNPAVVWVFIPIIAILGGTVTTIIRKCQKHRERMAMIAAGMHPDFPIGGEPDDDEPFDEGGRQAYAVTADHRAANV